MFVTPPWIEWLAFGISLTGVFIIFALSILAALMRDFQFFPPPNKQSWQHMAFLALFRIFLYPLIALTIIAFEPINGIKGWLHYSVGGLLILIGFGLAFRITLQMGWRNAFGEKRGLVTSGWFARSRNPIYVATWFGLTGWALVANDIRVGVLLTLWAILYWIAPRFEEPWLEEQYGDEYRAYKAQTIRFF